MILCLNFPLSQVFYKFVLRSAAVLFAIAAMGICFSSDAAQTVPPPQTESLINESKQMPFHARNLLTPYLSWGGETVIQLGSKGDMSFQGGKNIDFNANELKFGIHYRPVKRFSAYSTLMWQKVYRLDNTNSDDFVGFESAYLAWNDEQGEPSLFIGRQYYEDSRGFLFHQSLDGLHGDWQWQQAEQHWRLNLTFARQGVWDRDLRQPDKSVQDVQLLWLTFTRLGWQIAAYSLATQTHYDPMSPDFAVTADDIPASGQSKPITFGLRGQGDTAAMLGIDKIWPLNNMTHWFELAYVTGEEYQRKLSGTGVDLGLLIPLSDSKLTLILGYAFGSGDEANLAEITNNKPVDKRFRQSGFQLNNGWLGEGGAKFKYYGELVKPELSNIAISTLGLRLKPNETSSIELVYHDYQQDQASSQFYGQGIKVTPNGINPELGEAVDLILSYRAIKGLKLELDISWFSPRQAFQSSSHNAKDVWQVYTELRYHF